MSDIQTTTFKGARYVPKFEGVWDSTREYEAISAVQYNAYTYLSKKPVPAGVEITNTNFWVLWADPNAQMQQLHEEVVEYDSRVTDVANNVETLSGNVNNMQSNVDDNTRMIMGTPFGMKVDDWVLRFTIEPIGGSGYMNSFAYDETSDSLYICFYMGGNTSIIRKYDNITQVQTGGMLTHSSQLSINNNHCNSCSISNNKLYASSWNDNYISIVDLSDFSFVENMVVGYNIRQAVVYRNIVIVQPYNANYLVKYFMNSNHEDDLDYAMSVKIPLASQREYVEDAHILANYLYRVCGMNDNAISNPYIEVYPTGYNSSPIIVPIDFYIDGEWQSITNFSNGMLIGYDENIYFSEKLRQAIPQVEGDYRISNLWRDSLSQMLNSGTVNTNGLPYVYDDTQRTFTIEFPSGFIAGCKTANALAPILSMSIRMKIGTSPHGIFNHMIDLTNLTTTQHSQFTLISNSGAGFYMYTMYADLNNDVLTIKVNDCYEYATGTQTLTKIEASTIHADVYGGIFKLII